MIMTIRYLIAKLITKLHLPAVIDSQIAKTARVGSASHIVSSVFGRYTYCGNFNSIINCEVGNFCSIANNVSIGGASHPMERVSTSPAFYGGKRNGMPYKLYDASQPLLIRTTIGSDVWIGEGVIIKAGITIGNGSVIGSGSVVTKDVEPYAIVAGNPAKLIRYRFSEDVIAKLQKCKWWEFSDDKLKSITQFMNSPQNLIDFLSQKKQ